MAVKTVLLPEEEPVTCPFGRLLQVLGKPHTLQILYGLGVRSPMRFTELQKELKIQPKTLTARLHELTKIGLLERKSYDEIPPRVEYELTQKGKDLSGMFSEASIWAKKYGFDFRSRQTKN